MYKYCQHCEDEFEAKRENAQYCSSNCRQKAYLNRKKEGDSIEGISNQDSEVESEFPDFEYTHYYPFLLDGNEDRDHKDETSNYGFIYGGAEAFHTAHLSSNKLLATEDVSNRLLKIESKSEALRLIELLREDSYLSRELSEIIRHRVLFFRQPSYVQLHCCLGKVCKVFRLLLLFDRQVVPVALLFSVLEEFKAILSKLEALPNSESERNFVGTMTVLLLKAMESERDGNELQFGLSNKMRRMLQTFLMTKDA